MIIRLLMIDATINKKMNVSLFESNFTRNTVPNNKSKRITVNCILRKSNTLKNQCFTVKKGRKLTKEKQTAKIFHTVSIMST